MRFRDLLCGCLAVSVLFTAAASADVAGYDGGASAEVSFWSGLDFELYGYVKLDAAWDDGATAPGEFVKWVEPGSGERGGGWSTTPNQTRFGLRAGSRADRPAVAGGRVEIDFYGEVDEPDPRIRHAYVELGWPARQLGILFGQTSDVISPLAPSTLNYTVAWWAGNIGFRRPQLRVTKGFAAGGRELTLEAAVTHNVYDTKVGGIAGEDAGPPALQARVSTTFAAAGGRGTLGVSGHRAYEDFEKAGGRSRPGRGRCKSWSANLDLSLPLHETLLLTGELFGGESLSPYLGGIGQGVDAATFGEVASRGGWLSLAWTPVRGKTRYNLGVSMDDVDGDDVSAGDREYNGSLFGNALWGLHEHFDLGFELSYWHTRYRGGDEAGVLRSQLSIIYKL